MNSSEPIKDKNKIHEIGEYLKRKNEKYYILFLLGLQSGLRVNDILPLTLGDVKIMELQQKLGKEEKGYLNQSALRQIYSYAKENGITDCDYLIPSQKAGKDGKPAHLTRTAAFRVIREAGEACGMPELTLQALRKTYGYHYYVKNSDIVSLARIYGNTNVENTLSFIGMGNDAAGDGREMETKRTLEELTLV